MILELTFLLGILVGDLSSFLIFYLLFRDDLKALDEFEKRQERYRKMI